MKSTNRKRHSGVIRSAIVFLGCAPLAVFGGPPDTQSTSPIAVQVSPAPSTKPLEEGGAHKSEHSGNGEETRGHAHQGQHPAVPMNAGELEEAMAFMKAHSPERYNAWESLPEGARKQRIKNVFAAAYAPMSRIPKEDRLYKNAVSRVETEDEIYGVVTKLRRVPLDKQDAIKSQLREKVELLVKINLEERQIRLENLQSTVERERKVLAGDQANRDSLVNNKLNEIVNDERGLGAGMGGALHGHPGPRQGEPNSPPQ